MSEVFSIIVGALIGAIVAQVTSVFDKSKIMFEKQFEAASSLHEITAGFLTTMPEQFDLEWEADGLPEIACKFDKIKKDLEKFRKQYSAALSEEELNLIDSAVQAAVSGSLSFSQDDTHSPDMAISNETKRFANKLYEDTKRFEKEFRRRVVEQSRILPDLSRLLTLSDQRIKYFIFFIAGCFFTLVSLFFI